MRNGSRRTWRFRKVAAAILLLLAPVLMSAIVPSPAFAQRVKGELTAVVENGYARLVFRLEEEVEAQVRLANNILTVTFQRPVDILVDRINASAPDYLSAARRDPDGKAVRIALARKVTMNSIAAGERLFVDLLPDGWSGLPPGLPRDVIEELARRARDAERRGRQQRMLARQNKKAPIRVRAISQPTFSRYVFDLPDLISVSADNTRDKLTLTFDARLSFDLADAKATLPATIEGVDSESDQDAAIVHFRFATKVDVRTFREDNSYVVDVASAERQSARQPDTVPSDELSKIAAELAAQRTAAPSDVRELQTAPARAAMPAAPEQLPPPEPQQPPRAAPAAPIAPVNPPAPAAAAAEPPQPKASPQATPPALPKPQAAVAPARDERTAPPVPLASEVARSSGGVDGMVRATLKRNGDNVSLTFPFDAPTPAAIFRRADTVWLVFDTDAAIAVAALNSEQGKTIRSTTASRQRNFATVRIKLDRPHLVSAAPEGTSWIVTIGNEVVEPSRPLAFSRNVVGPSRSSIIVPIDDVRNLHRIDDPDAGDTLYVATALAPARGLLKAQDFVEFRALASVHGIALQAIADDINVELAADKVVLTRPTGLTLSVTANSGTGTTYQRHVLDPQSWGFDRQAEFGTRKAQLIMAAADAPESKRLNARCDLARFYLARDMYPEAKAVLDVALADNPPSAEDSTSAVLRAVANIMIGRADVAIKDLSNPFVGNQHDAPLWRAMAHARLGKWAEAREGFREAGASLATLPLEIQRICSRTLPAPSWKWAT